MRFRSILQVVVLAVLGPRSLDAQQRDAPVNLERGVHVSGRVVDRTTGAGLSSVQLMFTPADSSVAQTWAVSSDSAGVFDVQRIPLGRYELRAEALAFSELTHRLTFFESGSIDLQISMAPAALELEPIVVTATRLAWLAEEGFYERRLRGLGYLLSRAEIEARSPYLVSDLFYGIPGADVISERTGQTQALVVLRGRCVPQVVLDGAPFSAPIPIDQVVAVADLEAMEVYHGSTGPIRHSSSSCGTIMLWTRRSSAGDGSPLTWKRLIGAAAIVALFTLSLW